MTIIVRNVSVEMQCEENDNCCKGVFEDEWQNGSRKNVWHASTDPLLSHTREVEKHNVPSIFVKKV